jgi:ABC-type hemin transport system ATPase subunit
LLNPILFIVPFKERIKNRKKQKPVIMDQDPHRILKLVGRNKAGKGTVQRDGSGKKLGSFDGYLLKRRADFLKNPPVPHPARAL